MQTKPLSLTHLVRQPLQPPTDGAAPPLLVLAHGYGSNEQDLMGLAGYFDPRLMIVSVRAPLTMGQGSYAWFELEYTANGVTADPERMNQGLAALTGFLSELPNAYKYDPSRVLMGGFSQGAMLSLGVLLHQPQSIGGANAHSGRLWPGAAEHADREALSGKPVLVTHGTYDTVLPIANGRAIRAALSELPVDLTYHEYPMAHEINGDALRDVLAWIETWLSK